MDGQPNKTGGHNESRVLLGRLDYNTESETGTEELVLLQLPVVEVAVTLRSWATSVRRRQSIDPPAGSGAGHSRPTRQHPSLLRPPGTLVVWFREMEWRSYQLLAATGIRSTAHDTTQSEEHARVAQCINCQKLLREGEFELFATLLHLQKR